MHTTFVRSRLIFVALSGLLLSAQPQAAGSLPQSEWLPTPVITAVLGSPRQLVFKWKSVERATSYRLLGNSDGVSAFVPAGDKLDADATSATLEVPVHFHDWVNAQYRVEACVAADRCSYSNPVSATSVMLNAIGYFKASNTEASASWSASDHFGSSIALSRDGTTLAVGAPYEQSKATGVNGDQTDDSANMAGAVYVFVRSGTQWVQQAYVKASNTDAGDRFGFSVALDGFGNQLAVGAPNEDSNGINGQQGNSNNIGIDSGAVYVFKRNGSDWSQEAYLKASKTGQGDAFGYSVSLASGSYLAVGAIYENSSATGVNGADQNDSAPGSGAAYVFTRTNGDPGTWSQQAYLKASNTGQNYFFGSSVSISGDSSTLAVGSKGEASNASLLSSGAAYVFKRNGTQWAQQAYVKASNAGAADFFGSSVSLDGGGNTLAVGAPGERSNAVGIGGNQSNDSFYSAGAVYVFARGGVLNNLWVQKAYVKASNTAEYAQFGTSVALSSLGSVLAVGAIGESGGDAGVNGIQSDHSAAYSGAVYVYTLADSNWSQKTYVKASNTNAADYFGTAVGLSFDGSMLAVGALGEDSNATGVGGSQVDNSTEMAGAAYVY